MGIHGIFKEIGPGQRISLVKLASDHYIAHNRPFRLAIDISIWLFQIQAGKGGSNPALRTFYYRLLRLLSFNIHPLFVFDGPNKPLFKRNKKVGGPGVRVASVPEFLAKQLLKQFGFPWHVAPGEAEAECALLQREGIVDAVLSEDVDTLMFGSGVTLRNWSSDNSSKSPTHVNVFKARETLDKSGLDREGMILVALMSGGDYITEGIPGCGPKVACDAARAGFGKEMCELVRKRDTAGMKAWRERLQREIRTNESKFFTRKNTKLAIPEEFPDREVLGYYTNPCLSTADKLARLKEGLKWDLEIDFPALRSFAADAFDWRCLGGAKKFIRNLAPAMLVRQLRLCADENVPLSQEAQAERENEYVTAIHGKRNHNTTDGELEYRITFIPMNLVPIDLSIEDEDDEFIPAGAPEDPSEAENDFMPLPSSTADEDEPSLASPTKTRTAKPYEPDQPEKIWMMHSFLKVGCPLLVEDYESSLRNPKQALKQRRKAKAAPAGGTNIHSKTKGKKKASDMPAGALEKFTSVTKSSHAETESVNSSQGRNALREMSIGVNSRSQQANAAREKKADKSAAPASGFRLQQIDTLDEECTPKAVRQPNKPMVMQDNARPFKAFAAPSEEPASKKQLDPQSTPKRSKRRLSAVASPALSQMSIQSFFSPSPRRPTDRGPDVIDLISPTPVKTNHPRALSPTPRPRKSSLEGNMTPLRRLSADFMPDEPPDTVTRRTRGPLKRHKTAPARGQDIDLPLPTLAPRPSTPDLVDLTNIDADGSLSDPEGLLPDLPPMRRLDERRPASTTNVSARDVPLPKTSNRPSTSKSSRPSSSKSTKTNTTNPAARRPPPPQAEINKKKKQRIELRDSVPGSFRIVDIETVDMTGDGSGWKATGGRAQVSGWRKSGIEELDLTGA